MENQSKCPITGHGAPKVTNRDWWPEQIDLRVLHQNPPVANPMGEDFIYAAEFQFLDLQAVKNDLYALMRDSQDWWPADYGHYGPLMIRMAWHAAGTYRMGDGRGGASSGNQRFAPLNSWPDNANLDKARRLLWPIKKKYGRKLSWADLHGARGQLRAGGHGVRDLRFRRRPRGHLGARGDIYWGPEAEWLGDKRYSGEERSSLSDPLAAVQMGLIYVNPEGPNGEPDPAEVGPGHPRDLRPHGHERRGDRRAHRGRPHLRQVPRRRRPGRARGREPEGATIVEQGLGWKSTHGRGHSGDTITSGIEGAWTPTPTSGTTATSTPLFGYEWELTKSPAGAWQWTAKGGEGTVPDAFTRQEARPHDDHRRPRPALRPDLRAHRAASTRTRTSSPTPSPGPGSSSPTATWAPSRDISVRRSRASSCSGRIRCPRSTTS